MTWPAGNGEMVKLIRAHDWSATALGPSAEWTDRLKAAVEMMLASPLVATLAVGQARLFFYNDAAAALYGARHPNALGRSLAIVFPETFADVSEVYDRVFAGESVKVSAKPLAVGGPGSAQIFDAYLTPVCDGDGIVLAATMCGIEIGDRIRAEAALRDSEQRYRAFVTASSDVVYRMSPDWMHMRQLDGFGFLADTEEPDENWRDRYILPGDRDHLEAAIARAITDRAMFELEHPVIRADGSAGWTLSRAVPIIGEDDAITEWLGAASDITDQRRTREALEASEARLQTLVAELQHRVRNILSVVRSVFTRTADAGEDIEDVVRHFQGRLDSLARTQVIVTRTAQGTADLESLIRDELLSVAAEQESTPSVEGPELSLDFENAEMIGLAVHELTTNALKYGALRFTNATLEISWHINIDYMGRRFLDLIWDEHGVPMVSLSPSRSGFGRELIEQALPYRTGATTRLDFRGGGVRCEISLPLPPA